MRSRLLYAIYGAGGHGRETMPLAAAMLAHGKKAAELVFVDSRPPARIVNGRTVMTYQEFLEADAREKYVNIAMANSVTRQTVAEQCAADGIGFFSVSAENVVLLDQVEVAEGAILSPFVTLTCNVKIGKHFHANYYSHVSHDCVIGDYVTFAPGVRCNGNIVVEDHAYIGSGAVLRHGKRGNPLVIGRSAVVGMGAVVTKSVAAGVTVVGNPARSVQSRPE